MGGVLVCVYTRVSVCESERERVMETKESDKQLIFPAPLLELWIAANQV